MNKTMKHHNGEIVDLELRFPGNEVYIDIFFSETGEVIRKYRKLNWLLGRLFQEELGKAKLILDDFRVVNDENKSVLERRNY